ncbi:ATP-binding cassette domain-containing protein [Actinocrinis puniceicyclus]|uniref:ATP-binding cassette domain-containing protein n=1 Tax=Actinocrinis puniceicyclus TaxID=977794 RepID=A0A8J8BC80_9ACTN|nr:ATP-binding cassette domain-containing protein [Actinocrinis puniceicyclus]MBS2962841.1 ATP-binding cassette domain-containing protein [Actinocrinis puniceicyclus]
MSLPSDNPVLDARGLVLPADGSVLNQVGLAVGEGETVAVLGGPGSGKSALKTCLSGETIPASGTVWTNGKPVHLLPPDQRRAFRLRHYGLVHQEAVFLPELTLAQNTALPLRFAGTGESAAARRVLTWLSRFEIADAADQRPTGLPVAVLRRAALVRAMVNDPLVLLADEPFLGLDEDAARTTFRILRSVARSHGTALIVFTRDATTAASHDRTVHLVDGRVQSEPVPAPPAPPVPPAEPPPRAAKAGR